MRARRAVFSAHYVLTTFRGYPQLFHKPALPFPFLFPLSFPVPGSPGVAWRDNAGFSSSEGDTKFEPGPVVLGSLQAVQTEPENGGGGGGGIRRSSSKSSNSSVAALLEDNPDCQSKDSSRTSPNGDAGGEGGGRRSIRGESVSSGDGTEFRHEFGGERQAPAGSPEPASVSGSIVPPAGAAAAVAAACSAARDNGRQAWSGDPALLPPAAAAPLQPRVRRSLRSFGIASDRELDKGRHAAGRAPELGSASGSADPTTGGTTADDTASSIVGINPVSRAAAGDERRVPPPPPPAMRQLRLRGSTSSSCAKVLGARAPAAAGGDRVGGFEPAGGKALAASAAGATKRVRADPTVADAVDNGEAHASACGGGSVGHRGRGAALSSGPANGGSAGGKGRARGAGFGIKTSTGKTKMGGKKREREDGVEDARAAAGCEREESEPERLNRKAFQKRQELDDSLSIKVRIVFFSLSQMTQLLRERITPTLIVV